MLLLLLATQAHAFKVIPYAWPLGTTDEAYEVEERSEGDLSAAQTRGAVDAGFSAWTSQGCAGVEAFDRGTCPSGGFTYDGLNRVTFEDPLDELPAGVLAATECHGSGTRSTIDGQTVQTATDCDTVFNDAVAWMNDGEIAGGDCADAYSLTAVAAHAAGHFWGLGHSCDEDDDVSCGEGHRAATMYWQTSPCDASQSSIEDDDRLGLDVLYGTTAGLVCEGQGVVDVNGAYTDVPGDVTCRLVERDDVALDVAWDFGDGGTATGSPATHTYATSGDFAVAATLTGVGPSCTQPPPVAVLACAPPEPAFTAQQADGLTWTMLNDTPLPEGCVTDVLWTVAQAGRTVLTSTEWEPDIAFPEAGSYDVTLDVVGPAGEGKVTETVDVTAGTGDGSGKRHCGCDSGRGAVPAAWLAGLLALAIRPRRRSWRILALRPGARP